MQMMNVPYDIIYIMYRKAPIDVKVKLHRCHPILRHSVRKSVKLRLKNMETVHASGKIQDVTKPGMYSTIKHKWTSGDYELESTRFSRVIVFKRKNSRTGEIKETWSNYGDDLFRH